MRLVLNGTNISICHMCKTYDHYLPVTEYDNFTHDFSNLIDEV